MGTGESVMGKEERELGAMVVYSLLEKRDCDMVVEGEVRCLWGRKGL